MTTAPSVISRREHFVLGKRFLSIDNGYAQTLANSQHITVTDAHSSGECTT